MAQYGCLCGVGQVFNRLKQGSRDARKKEPVGDGICFTGNFIVYFYVQRVAQGLRGKIRQQFRLRYFFEGLAGDQDSQKAEAKEVKQCFPINHCFLVKVTQRNLCCDHTINSSPHHPRKFHLIPCFKNRLVKAVQLIQGLQQTTIV